MVGIVAQWIDSNGKINVNGNVTGGARDAEVKGRNDSCNSIAMDLLC